MKTKNYLIVVLAATAFLSQVALAQSGNITLTFSGEDNGVPVPLESVWVKNLSQNCDTTLYPPYFTLIIDTLMTGIDLRVNLSA